MEEDFVTFLERRREWSPEAKARILEEASRPGAVVAEILSKYRVANSMFYRWRKQAREGKLPGISISEDAPPGFAPVMIAAPKNNPASGIARKEPAHAQITFGNGRVLKIAETIEPALLRRLIAVVDG